MSKKCDCEKGRENCPAKFFSHKVVQAAVDTSVKMVVGYAVGAAVTAVAGPLRRSRG